MPSLALYRTIIRTTDASGMQCLRLQAKTSQCVKGMVCMSGVVLDVFTPYAWQTKATGAICFFGWIYQYFFFKKKISFVKSSLYRNANCGIFSFWLAPKTIKHLVSVLKNESGV